MKGAAALVGAVDMQQAAAAAEAAGRRDDIDGMQDAAQRLSRALDLLAVWVER
jgi:HPt (histidine-containing phosphotransfer) domain-containing protein